MSTPNSAAANGTSASNRSVWTKLAVLLLLTMTFFLALTTARNADIWAHLASGRQAASGTVSRPLSWLADLTAYLVYSVLGGAGLIFGKTLLIVATVAVLLGRADSWRAVLGLFLASLALGGWLPLNPVCASYLFLAVAVVAFDRRPEEPESAGWRDELRSHWSLLLCFILWANVDARSLLGVAVLGAWVVGQSLVRVVVGEPLDRGAWRLFLLLMLTQAVSPLPWFPSAVAGEFKTQLTSPEAGASPFRRGVLSIFSEREFAGLVPVCAFWLLVCVGASSFALALRSPSDTVRSRAWGRLFPVLGLFVAAAINVRFVPFFIVVCGAAVVQNFRSLPTGGMELRPAVRGRSRVERLQLGVQCLFGVAAAVALLGGSWVGWFQSLPAERRNWTLEPDPSLVAAAEQVEQWYTSGLLNPEQETVFFATDAEEVFSWFAPRTTAGRRSVERGPAGVERVRAAVLAPERGRSLGAGADVLGDQRVGCVVLCDASRGPFTAALRNMTAPPREWVLAHLRGRVAVFVRAGSGPAARPVDLASRAFDPQSAERAEWVGGEAFAVRPRWFDPLVLPRPPRSIDRDEAVAYLLYEEATRDHRMVRGADRFLATQLASLGGAPAMTPAAWVSDPRAVMLTTAAGAVRPPSEAPPPLPFGRFASFLILTDVTADHYLAVRAARRGVAASPRDAASYEALGEAYLHLLNDPLEASWSESVPALRRLRLNQAAAAFWQALAIEPARAASHLGLGTIYLERQFLDLALSEFRAHERLARLQGQQASDAAERVRSLERAVESARRSTEANAANLSVLDRARLAVRNGLAGQALDALLQSDVAAFGATGSVMELDLLLAVGRAGEAREWAAPEQRQSIGAAAYDWLRIQAAAAVGDYAGASAILLNQILTSTKPDAVMSGKELLAAVKIAAEETLFKRQYPPRMAIALFTSVVNRLADSARQVALDYQARSEGYLLLALLAMEQGDLTACDGYLGQLLGLWDNLGKVDVNQSSPHRVVALQMRALIRR